MAASVLIAVEYLSVRGLEIFAARRLDVDKAWCRVASWVHTVAESAGGAAAVEWRFAVTGLGVHGGRG